MKTILSLVSLALASCAHTTFYREGKPIARFEGDMTNVVFRQHPDGTVEWSSDTVSHSAATAAQGKAGSDKIAAIGTAAASAGIVTLLK